MGIMKNAKSRLWVLFVASFILMAFVIFLAAGALDYWQAWAYLAVGSVSSTFLTLYIISDPRLLENRSRAGFSAEQRPIQKIILCCMIVPLVAVVVVPGLDHRFGWSNIPLWLTAVGDGLVLASMWIVYRVFKENPFGAATIEIQKDQKVISTGPYAIVRNPMYASASIYFVGMSLALGSFWALIPSGLVILGFFVRLLDEERFLSQTLPGYEEYCTKVRWHLIPGLF